MALWKRNKNADAPSPAPAASFSVDAQSIPPEIFGLTSYTDTVARAGRVARPSAIQVPAVKRCRDLIPGTLGTLPFVMRDEDSHEVVPSELLKQPERDIPASVTYAKTFDDLFFEGVAWWLITESDEDDFPLHVVRLEPGTVDVNVDGQVYDTRTGHHGTALRYYEDAELIRFDSPNDAFLLAAARAIRSALSLDAAAAGNSDGTPPIEFFTAADGIDPGDDDDIKQMLADYREARRTGGAAYIPAALKHNVAGWNPEQLQMAEARQHAVLEIARCAGVDPEDLGVSTTSRTYANSQDRRKSFTDFTLGGYLRAFEDRLSMNDVSKPGTYARADLAAFLRSDDLTRMQTYQLGLSVGAYADKNEVRAAEQKPPLTDDQAQAPTPEESNVVPLAAAQPPHLTFEAGASIRLDAPGAIAFAVDREARTISGLLVPYGVPAKSNGRMWQFSRGTLTYADVSRVKLWINHDPDRAVGVARELDDREDGLYGTFSVARGAAGDEALTMAEDGVWDGFSIGLREGGTYKNVGGIMHAVKAPLMETSLTPSPSFDDARVHAVAASATHKEKDMTPAQRARLAELRAIDAASLDEAQAAELATLEALEAEHPEDNANQHSESGDVAEAVAAGVTKAFATFAKPLAREVVKAGRTMPTKVTEEAPYRFGGQRGAHDFSADIIAGLRDHDNEAQTRVLKFMAEQFPATPPQFAIASTDVNELNPTKNRPEMYVDRLEWTTPLYKAFFKGGLDDGTPFMFPKFVSASGLLADHSEGVEPTSGTFVTTSQTVTPGALSGKATINREVWDAGGNPQVSTLIWNEMVRTWAETMEAKAATLLASSTPGSGGYPTAKTLTAGAADDDLVNELEAFLASLQFIQGGNHFDVFSGHANLYLKLVDAVDADGRKLLPMIGAANTNGTAKPKFTSLDVAGQPLDPAWALGAASSAPGESFLADSKDVHVWNTAPKRMTFEYQVATVDIAIWGYQATAISRPASVQSVLYDPVP